MQSTKKEQHRGSNVSERHQVSRAPSTSGVNQTDPKAIPDSASANKQLPPKTRDPPKTGNTEKSPRSKMKQQVQSFKEASEAEKKVINLKPLDQDGSVNKLQSQKLSPTAQKASESQKKTKKQQKERKTSLNKQKTIQNSAAKGNKQVFSSTNIEETGRNSAKIKKSNSQTKSNQQDLKPMQSQNALLSSGDVVKQTETNSCDSRQKSNPTSAQEEESKKAEAKPEPAQNKELIVSDRDSHAADDESSNEGFETSSPDVRRGNQSEEEAEREAMIQQLKVLQKQALEMPPPLELLAKTVYIEEEPVLTGAPIAFVRLDKFNGGKMRDVENLGKSKAEKGNSEPSWKPEPELKPDVLTLRENAANLQAYMSTMYTEGYVVYCRFGKEYIGQMAKLNQSLINNPNLTQPMRQIATYLINIKKLVRDHNIDSETKDFNKLKTTKPGKINKTCLPPAPYYFPESNKDRTLIFESRFETGNLLAAMKISNGEYDLVLQNDINTNGHTQWFFFRVSNTFKGQTVKFNILNLAKPDSLYNFGMRILSYSVCSRQGDQELGWHRVGKDIDYSQNTLRRENTRFTRYYYTLTWTYTFDHDADQVYFAHCFPYTYSDLTDDLARIERDRFSQNFINRSTLCRTLAGNRCEYLTITSKDKDPNDEKAKAKKGVFISSRVHPGESNASWMMKGVIDFLVSNTAEAQALRDNFVFKIVPMLNPDGVINGNYRCSLSGQDLNRRWKNPSKILHPVNSAVKKLIRQFNREREIVLVCDLHGHSRRKNIFMYGNNFSERPHSTRVFPFIMSKLCDFFSFEYSRFSVHKSKESTARVTLWRELKIPNVFTMEASFCGADKGQLKDTHFQPEHFMLSGRRLLEALIVYCKIPVNQDDKKKKQQQVDQKQPPKKQAYQSIKLGDLEKELAENKKLIEMTTGDEEGEDESGSDSSPSEDNLEEEEMAKIIPIKPKKKEPQPPPSKGPQIKKKPELVKRPSKSQLQAEKSPTAGQKRQTTFPQQVPARSPMKRIFPYPANPYDRLKGRGMRKVEMVDKCTQTSNHGSDNEEKRRKSKTQTPVKTSYPQAHLVNQSRIQSRGQEKEREGQISFKDHLTGLERAQYIPHSHTNYLQMNSIERARQMTRQNTNDNQINSIDRKKQVLPPGQKQYAGSFFGQTPDKTNPNSQSLNPGMSNLNNSVNNPQIRIRKDPIKSSGQRKPPSLAVFEEALLQKQGETAGSNKQSSSFMQRQSFGSSGQKVSASEVKTIPPQSLTQQFKLTLKQQQTMKQQALGKQQNHYSPEPLANQHIVYQRTQDYSRGNSNNVNRKLVNQAVFERGSKPYNRTEAILSQVVTHSGQQNPGLIQPAMVTMKQSAQPFNMGYQRGREISEEERLSPLKNQRISEQKQQYSTNPAGTVNRSAIFPQSINSGPGEQRNGQHSKHFSLEQAQAAQIGRHVYGTQKQASDGLTQPSSQLQVSRKAITGGLEPNSQQKLMSQSHYNKQILNLHGADRLAKQKEEHDKI